MAMAAIFFIRFFVRLLPRRGLCAVTVRPVELCGQVVGTVFHPIYYIIQTSHNPVFGIEATLNYTTYDRFVPFESQNTGSITSIPYNFVAIFVDSRPKSRHTRASESCERIWDLGR